MRWSLAVPLLLAAVLLAGCASTPPSPAPSVSAKTGARAAAQALKMVGKRYRYGGASPSQGFDCSGLVQYSYRQAGVKLPRSTAAQLRATRPIRRAELRRGDLIFFDEKSGPDSHVGIYLGDGTFVHAPSSGKKVRRDRLDSPYWRRHISELRRVSG
ncbi:MAG TPA: C40 family peptidase [Burkholderiales bacterium]